MKGRGLLAISLTLLAAGCSSSPALEPSDDASPTSSSALPPGATAADVEGREGPTGSACIGFRLIARAVVGQQVGLADLTPRFEIMDADAQDSVDPRVVSASAALLAATKNYDATGDQSTLPGALSDMDEACTDAGFPA